MTFEIIQIPRDDEAIRKYVDRYKEFRLLSLKVAPEAFGSTLERELAFTDETWHSRLANPQAVTFLALQGELVVSTLTTVGPLPFSPEESPPLANPWKALDGNLPEGLKQSHWRINGMFTRPEFRGQGIAQALMEKAVKFGNEEALRTGREFAGSVVVDSDNPGAKSLYEKSGYKAIREEARELGSTRTVLLMKYSPPLVERTIPS